MNPEMTALIEKHARVAVLPGQSQGDWYKPTATEANLLVNMRHILSRFGSELEAARVSDARDDIGLSVDILDVDRLRDWARLLLVHGADVSHWASVPHLASRMQTLATGLEKAIQDIGVLRDARASSEALLAAVKKAQQFIRNGVELGYIRMPDAGSGDTALETPGEIDAAIAKAEDR